MELVLKTSEQKCFVGSNPTASAIFFMKPGFDDSGKVDE
jgi:hypothetical protein